MITLTNTFLFLTYKRIWFANAVPDHKAGHFISLRQYTGSQPLPTGWREKSFTTLLTDLTEEDFESMIDHEEINDLLREDRDYSHIVGKFFTENPKVFEKTYTGRMQIEDMYMDRLFSL